MATLSGEGANHHGGFVDPPRPNACGTSFRAIPIGLTDEVLEKDRPPLRDGSRVWRRTSPATRPTSRWSPGRRAGCTASRSRFVENRLLYLSAGSGCLTLVAGLCPTLWQYAEKSCRTGAGKSEVARRRRRTRRLPPPGWRLSSGDRRCRRDWRNPWIREERSIRKSRPVGFRCEVFDRVRCR